MPEQLSRAAQCVRYLQLMRGPPGGPDLRAESAAVGDVEAGAAGPGADFGDGWVGPVGGSLRYTSSGRPSAEGTAIVHATFTWAASSVVGEPR